MYPQISVWPNAKGHCLVTAAHLTNDFERSFDSPADCCEPTDRKVLIDKIEIVQESVAGGDIDPWGLISQKRPRYQKIRHNG